MYFFITVHLIVFLLVLYVILQRKRKRNTFSFPEPPGSLLFGHIFEITSSSTILNLFSKYTRNHRTVQIRMGPKVAPLLQIVLTKDHKLADFVLNQNPHTVKRSQNYRRLVPWFGPLIMGETPKYKQYLKLLKTSLQTQNLKQFFEIFESAGNILIEKINHTDFADSSIDIYPLLRRCTMDIITEIITDTKFQTQIGKHDDYLRSVDELLQIITKRLTSPLKAIDCIFALTIDYRLQQRALKVIRKWSSQVLQNKKQKLDQNESKSKKKSFLELLLRAEDGNINSDVQYAVDSIMFAGSESSAVTTAFLLFSLAKYPEVQDQVLKEQKELFGEEKNPLVTFEHLQNMKYLELVIKETLRLYPTGVIIEKCTKEDIFFEGHTIPKNTDILIFTYGLHRDPEYFQNPEKFDPSRFAKSDAALPCAYIPFSSGPTSCTGKKFAMVVTKAIVSKVVRHFQLVPSKPEHNLELVLQLILNSRNGIRVAFKKRL